MSIMSDVTKIDDIEIAVTDHPFFRTVKCVATIMFALEHKRELSGQWGWMVASGVVDLVLAGIILMGLPQSAAWAIGLLIGVNLVFGGSALIAMALHARNAAPASST